MTQDPSFGGPWTQEKLEILRRYLDTYTTVLKEQPSADTPFRLTYVDAFAGSGSYQVTSSDQLVEYRDFDTFRQGSARIALDTEDRPFDRLIYIEKNRKFISSLQSMKEANTHRNIEVINRDANLVLPDICSRMSSLDRAVIFLDPFATDVDWTTVQAIADSKKVDCWIWFPLSALTRMMTRRQRPNAALSRKLDRIFGGREYWESELYHLAAQQPLFGDSELVSREPQDRIAEVYRNRIGSVFSAIAPTRRKFLNSRNSPMFELIFAAANPTGARRAIPIADYLLKNF